MYQGLESETDQADHSQVQSSEDEQRALEQGIPKILRTVEEIYMLFAGQKDFSMILKQIMI